MFHLSEENILNIHIFSVFQNEVVKTFITKKSFDEKISLIMRAKSDIIIKHYLEASPTVCYFSV